MTTLLKTRPSPLSIDELNAMPMKEVFKLVKDIEQICKQSIEDIEVYSDNLKVINEFIKNNITV